MTGGHEMRESVYSLETSFLVHSMYRVTDQFIHAYHMHARLGNEEQGCILSFGCPFRLLAAPANCQFCSSPHDMWMSIAALTLIVLLFTTGHSAVHEQVAAPPSGGVSFKGGFSLPIIHRNDPRSPLRDPTVTTLDLFKEEIQLASSPMPADDALASEKMLAPVHFRCGLYLVPLRIGGSLDRISSRYLMFDTGTDLSWTQCSPCYACARGHYPPSKSSTFRSVFCDDPLCEHSSGLRCANSPSRECIFF